MHRDRTPRARQALTASNAVGTWPRLLPALAIAAALVLSAAASASADITICSTGESAGHCANPNGVAADFETGHVYVADEGNDRIDAFQSDGTSLGPFGSGQLSDPAWVAVDNSPTSASRHDVWVTTKPGAGAEFLVKKFEPNGTFVEAASFGDPAKQGTGECEFKVNDPIAVGPEGHVYVADSFEKEIGPPDTFVNRVLVFSSAGSCLEEVPLFEEFNKAIRNFAVDSGGHMYVTVAGGGGAIRKYSPVGALEFEIALGPKDRGTEAEGLAIDDEDHLFAKQRVESVDFSYYYFTEFSPVGTKLRGFGYVKPPGQFIVPALAAYHSADGDLFASEGAEGIKYIPLGRGPELAPEPCQTQSLGNSKATLQARINPEGQETSFEFQYLTQAQFEHNQIEFGPAEGFHGAQSAEPATISPASEPFDLHEAATQVTGLEPETEYRCRVLAENSEDEGDPNVGEEGTFETREGFEFGPSWSSGVTETSATIFTEGNPLEIPATGQIEYVEDAAYQQSGFAEALSAPSPELEFGAGSAMRLVQATLTGLNPGTLYHYRLHVRNGTPPQGFICPAMRSECPELEHTFRTYGPEGGLLPEGRAWELVSPGQKSSAEVGVPGNRGGLADLRMIRIQAGAGNGEAITYTSWTSFGDAESAPSTSQYLSKRTPSGWSTENLSPFGFSSHVLFPPYNGFTPDLGFGVFKTTEPPLTADCPKGTAEDIYLRDNATGELHCLSPEVPGGPGSPCLLYGGASEDGGHVFIAGRPEGGEIFKYRLYEWTPGGIQVVSVLPNDEPAPATEGTSFGPSNTRNGVENCQVTRTRLASAISDDGSKAFWTYVPEAASEPTQLYARVDGSETVQLDALPAKTPGKGPAGNGIFWAASADGSVAYFTDTSRLLKGSHAETAKPDLYSYELGQGKPLTDLSEGAVPGDVKGVVGASDDGSYVYFVAGAILSGEEENAAGQKAKEGADNLYLNHEGTTTFIATLSPQDSGDWSAEPRLLSARVSPDGAHLAFLSLESKALAGYDNTLAEGEHCQYGLTAEGGTEFLGGPLCTQAFLYDAAEAGPGALSCASCNPSGARPLGPTVLPGWSNGFEGPRYLSDDGSRFFFQSFDALSQADVNAKSDVYELERPGTGSCDSESPSFDPKANGCHFLISSGKSEDESFLIDASSDGRNVFFSTRGKLVGWDKNENYDVYDAREGGGFPEPPLIESPCEGEGCKPPNAAPPPDIGSPATAGLKSAGNVIEGAKQHCPKGGRQVRRAGKTRCVKPPRHRGHKSHRRHRGGRGR